MKHFEIEKGKIDFESIWKIGKIDVDKVTFIKHRIERTMSMNDDKEIVTLEEIVGEETYKCIPDVILKLGGRVGDVIKKFEIERKGKTDVKVIRISEIEI